MEFNEYKNKVLKEALRKNKGEPVCLDTVRDSFNHNENIDEAVDSVLIETEYWNIGC